MTEYKRDKGSLRTADKGKISAADIRKMRATGKAIIYDSSTKAESTRPLEDVIKDFLEVYKLGPKYTKASVEAAWIGAFSSCDEYLSDTFSFEPDIMSKYS